MPRIRQRLSGLLTAALVAAALGQISAVAIQARAGAPGMGTHTALRGVDLDGQLHRCGEDSHTKVVVVVFLAKDCPVSNSYLPTLRHLHSSYRRLGMEMYGIFSDALVSRHEALEHFRNFRLGFPVLFDASGNLRRRLSPSHAPQAFVLSTRGEQLYTGAIDDRYVKLGRKKQQASKHFLEDAIKAVLAGSPVATRTSTPVGCLMEEPPDKSRKGTVTFNRDIAPIIQAHCACCHRPGQSGPFSLLSYQDVSRHARQIAETTSSRFMPPWKPAPNYGRFLGERRLSERDISLLEVWAKSGKPEGDPTDLPSVPKHTQGWRLGRPDSILRMRDIFDVPADGPDIRQYFVVPTRFSEDRLIAAIDFHPGTSQSIHHASFFLDTKHAGRRLDAGDAEPGYRGFGGPGFAPDGTLRSWFPGMSPRKLPNGMGRLIPRGADIVAEVHYVCTGKVEHDRSEIGLYFAPKSARQLVVEIQVANKEIKIPAGARRDHERASYTLPVDTILLDVAPHMHVLGREMKVAATLPDGTVEPLVWIKDWDFNWQSQYSYAEPIHLPKGSRIDVDAWYDNSSGNPLNPSSPPKTVRWGEEATDEMLICHFQCTCASMSELESLVADYERYFQTAQDVEATRKQSNQPVKQRRQRRPFR